MRAALRKALAKSPDDRFQTVREFIDAFSGAVVTPMATAPIAAGGPVRQRTEVGTPLDVGAAFGASPPMGPMGPVPGAPPQGYTPVGGNVAFPTPAGIPQPPPRDAGGAGNRRTLLVVAGLIGIVSVAAIGFAVKGSSGGGAKDVTFDNTNSQPAPETSLVATSTANGAPTPPAETGPGGGDIPPLNGGGPPHPQPHGNPNPGPGPAPPHTGPAPGPAPTPAPQPTTPPTPAPTRYDGPECIRARTLKALGHPREAQTWALACIAKGGSPN